MHLDPFLPRLVAVLAVLLALAIGLRRLGQPAPVVYLAAGILLGPDALDLLHERETIAHLGEYGVLLLLFFLGTEISLPALLKDWKVPILGTVLQVGLSLGVAAAVGAWVDWPIVRTVLLAFVISLSSTALVLKLLHERKELDSPVGRDVVAILLAQDLAIAPMLIVLGLLGGAEPTLAEVAAQVGVGLLLFGLVALVAADRLPEVPLVRFIRDDEELQVFGALLLALVLALVSGAAGLSSALGAFIGGIAIGASPDVHWVHKSLQPLRVLLLAVFLASVGAMMDLAFFLDNLTVVLALSVAALALNTLVNTVALSALGRPWKRALYGGALLAQIGEFSFVLVATGAASGAISATGRQLAICVIVVTLVAGAAWIALVTRLFRTGSESSPPLLAVPGGDGGP